LNSDYQLDIFIIHNIY